MTNSPDKSTLAAEGIAENIALQLVESATAVPRPNTVDTTWVEHEYEELEAEQDPLWAAAGLEKSRVADVRAAGLTLQAEAAQRMLDGHTTILHAAEDRYLDTVEALAPFRRRPVKTKGWYYATKAGLLIGDTAGISTAAIWMGEIPAIAVTMAGSAAIATVVASLTGCEVRDLRSSLQRQREVTTLTEKQMPFQHLFTGVDDGKRYVHALLGVSLSVGVIIAGSVFALRSAIENPLVGIVYGGFAGAIAAASFISSYMFADAIGDKLDEAKSSYVAALRRHTKLSSCSHWSYHTQYFAEAESIAKEHTERGRAARAHVRGLKFGILRRNPGIVGHGDEPDAVGRRTRRVGE